MQNESISERIKELLESSGKNQTYLADKLGVQRQAIYRLMKGETPLKSKYFPEIAKVLGVSEEYLRYGEKARALYVNDDELKQLMQNSFKLTDSQKIRLQDYFIKEKSDPNVFFFTQTLRIGIPPIYKAGSLAIFSTNVPNKKKKGQVFILFSALADAFVVGAYSKLKINDSLENEKGTYLVQPNDSYAGILEQVMLYEREKV